jgi:hypothetical protein
MNGIFLHSSNSEETAKLQELLQVGAHVFIRLATKWASLYHRNEASLDFKVSILGVDLGSSGHLISRGRRMFEKCLLLIGHRN